MRARLDEEVVEDYNSSAYDDPSEDDLPEGTDICEGCGEFYNEWELSEDGFCKNCEEQLP